MRRKGIRAEIDVSMRIRIVAGTSEIVDRALQRIRLAFPRAAAAGNDEVQV
jgi:hypothetical protein